MTHAALKSLPWVSFCGAGNRRFQNGVRNATPEWFVTLPRDQRCQKCEAFIRKTYPKLAAKIDAK